MYSIISCAKDYLNVIKRGTDNISETFSHTEKAKQIKAQTKTKEINELKERERKVKPIHGKYPIRASDLDVNSLLTHQWLALSVLKSETEVFIMAAQDQSLPTRNFQANILEKCRVCDNYTETIDHLASGCPMLAPKEYLNRHDR